MDKMGKRFIALLVVFTSIISFLPIKFMENGKAAKAASNSGTTIEVGGLSTSGETINSSNAPTYSTQKQFKNFTITIADQYTDSSTIAIGETAVTKQELIIREINRMAVDENTQSNANLAQIGCTITDINRVGGRVGKTITGLPLGVNEIAYSIKTTTVKRIADTTDTTNTAGVLTQEQTLEEAEQIIKIEHANSFVQSQIEYIDFTSYIGGRTDSDPTSNVKPFKYTSRLYSQQGKALKFDYEVPNSVTDLDYDIYFPNGVNTTDATSPDLVFVNGASGSGIEGSGNELKGTLQKTADSTLLVIAIRHQGALQNSYSIEVNYNDKASANDYSFKNGGITKLNYNADSDIKAYVGKEFSFDSEESESEGYELYTGTIYIDKLAGMINMEPILGRSASSTAFKISNHYENGGIAYSNIINGKQYVDFAAGTNNEIWLDIYAGTGGNIEGNILARYKLKVEFVTSDDDTLDTDVNFTFTDSYLTQPGKETKIDFDSSRRTYDLYFDDEVNITLKSPQTSHNEYFKVWLGDNLDEDIVTETADSKANNSDTRTIDVGNSKKMILQAYYDQLDDSGNVTGSYPIGYKYIFYIVKNEDTSGGGTDGTSDTNATLSGLKVSNGTLKDSSGDSGFSTDNYNYTVTVPQTDTSSTIIATADSSNVKSITATIVESGDEYELTSEESTSIPLDSNGKTTVKIVVTAGDGVTTKTYTVTIKNDTRSATATLKDVYLNTGDFTFDPDNDPTKVRVDQSVTSIKVTPVPDDSQAKVKVNGNTYSGTAITVDLKGSQETDITIKVTSADGTDSNTYTLEVYRTDSDLNTDDGEDDNEDDLFYDEINECWVDTTKYEEWGTVNGKQVYFDNKGRQVKEAWISTDGKLYYLNSKGYKENGWRVETDGKTYYLDSSTGEMRKGWINQNNSWYYLGLNGVMQKGWLYLNGKWYYFTSNGKLVTNQSMYIDGQIYNFAQDGSIY